jgi:hypothetical protein
LFKGFDEFSQILVRVGKPKESKKVGKYLENYRNEINEATNILALKSHRIKQILDETINIHEQI